MTTLCCNGNPSDLIDRVTNLNQSINNANNQTIIQRNTNTNVNVTSLITTNDQSTSKGKHSVKLSTKTMVPLLLCFVLVIVILAMLTAFSLVKINQLNKRLTHQNSVPPRQYINQSNEFSNETNPWQCPRTKSGMCNQIRYSRQSPFENFNLFSSAQLSSNEILFIETGSLMISVSYQW